MPRVLLLILLLLVPGCYGEDSVGNSNETSQADTRSSAARSTTDPSPRAEIAQPTPDQPVTFGAWCVPASAKPGDRVELIVQAKLAPDWHIYGTSLGPSPNRPTHLESSLPPGLTSLGDWSFPQPIQTSTPAGLVPVYENEVRFTQPVQLSADVSPGSIKIACDIAYQACDHSHCMPPTSNSLNASLEVLSP